jgi:hypothetical protein
MARVNDPPPPPETLEVLRRRFTRQNKDIIRSNLNQAQRIHGLEAEVSRLLAENLSLKRALITEQEEVARLHKSQQAGERLADVHAQLQQKFTEASALVGQLISRPRGVQNRNEQARKTTAKRKSVTISTPTREAWEHRKSLAAALQDQDGRLQAINENKLLDESKEDEVPDGPDNSTQTDSPEIGPPPIAHFEELESEDHSQDRSVTLQSESEEVPKVNFERRRKRRTSSLISEMEVSDTIGDQAAALQNPASPEAPRASAKRKLDASELEHEDQRVATIATSKESFVYHRRPPLKPALGARKSNRFSRPQSRPAQAQNVEASSPQKDSRKALASKSTNSPTKKTVEAKALNKGKDDDNRATARASAIRAESRHLPPSLSDVAIGRPPTRGKSTTSEDAAVVSQKPPRSRVAVLSDKEVESGSDPEAAPKTPFIPDDMLSPPSSKPSGPSNGRTTQEAVIMNSVEDVLNGSIGRGSRRAKAAVSYAEPNLRDKMRRPGHLVGAVEGYDRKTKEGAEHTHSRSASEGHDSLAQQSQWGAPGSSRAEPSSPLREKQTANEKRKRETSNLQAWAAGEPQGPVAAITASQANGHERPQVEKGMENLSIFDPPTSSPSGHDTLADDSIIEVQAPSSSATSRRRTIARATDDSASSRIEQAASSALERRRSLQPTGTSTSSSRSVSGRHALNGSALRTSTTTSLARSSSGLSKRPTSGLDAELAKPTSLTKSRSSASLQRHRRSTSDVPKPSARVTSTESNISNSDVEDESDYEASHLSAAGGDALDNSSIRTTRRRSMLV